MLALSVLIILALGVAVASFFVAGTQWLLVVCLGLISLAFYLSRRPSQGRPGAGDDADVAPGPIREHLTVTIDEQIIGPESGRHRDADSHDEPEDPRRHREQGRAIAS